MKLLWNGIDKVKRKYVALFQFDKFPRISIIIHCSVALGITQIIKSFYHYSPNPVVLENQAPCLVHRYKSLNIKGTFICMEYTEIHILNG